MQGTLAAAATASDAVGIGEVRFALDGAEIAAISAEPYAVDVDSAALAFGPHRLEATATDLAGNKSTASVSFNVDNPPVVSWRSPDDTTASGSVEIAASATDDDQVVALSLVVAGEEVDSATDGGPVSTILDTCGYASSELIEIEVMVVDSGGNISYGPRELSVNQPLSVAIDEIPGVAEPSQAVGAQVGDDERVVTVLWEVDGAGVATATSGSGTSDDCFDCGCSLYTSSFSTAGLSEGVHTLTATATNEAGKTASASTTFIVGYDHDGDGYDSDWYGGDDCDDTDGATRPDTSEACDGLDNDCDGSVDEDFDLDSDGFLDASRCAGLDGATDCDDGDPAVYIGAPERCDGIDGDCDGTVDEDPVDGVVYYTDGDGDGYGASASATARCEAIAGVSTLDGDCDDGLASIHPGASETCDEVDEDCDGLSDEEFDEDGDGYGSCSDCDDADADINPGATDSCDDGMDNDCDGVDPWCRVSGSHDMGSTGIKLRGEEDGDGAGRSLDGGGDQDGDGLADVLVGAYSNGEGGDDAGAVYIVPGVSIRSGSLGDSPAVKLIGAESEDYAGTSVSAVGDQDGDGYDDLVVGASGVDGLGTGTGAGLLVMGPTSADMDLSEAAATLLGEGAADNAGVGVGDAGDMNDDGVPDLWIGAPYAEVSGLQSGTLYVVFGPTIADMSLGDADLALLGESYNAFGKKAASGDTDGDGYSDLLVGVSLFSDVNAGVAYVVSGPATGSMTASTDADAALAGEKTREYVGASVALADVDGDGYDDAIVGANGRSSDSFTRAGAVYGVFGPVTTSLSLTTDADFTLFGAEENEAFGYAASAEDMDRDGTDDLVVGAVWAKDGGSAAGAAYVFYSPFEGSVAADEADASYEGEDRSDYLGGAVDIGGDINGDGPPDIVFGAYNEDDTSGTATGSAYVIYP